MGLSRDKIGEIQGRVRLLFDEADDFRHLYHLWRGKYRTEWHSYVAFYHYYYHALLSAMPADSLEKANLNLDCAISLLKKRYRKARKRTPPKSRILYAIPLFERAILDETRYRINSLSLKGPQSWRDLTVEDQELFLAAVEIVKFYERTGITELERFSELYALQRWAKSPRISKIILKRQEKSMIICPPD